MPDIRGEIITIHNMCACGYGGVDCWRCRFDLNPLKMTQSESVSLITVADL